MNRTIMICLAVLLILNLSACAKEDSSKSAANPSATVSTLQSDALPKSTEPPEPEMIEFQVDRYAVTADGAAYLAGAENTYKVLIDAVCSQKETEPYTDEDAAKRAAEVFAETPYSAFADVTAQNGTFQITYNETGDADTFDAAVKELIEGCVYKDANELEKALLFYRTVAQNFTLEGDDSTLYETLLEQRGSAADLAKVLTYLFVQNGISANRISGTVGETERNWTAAQSDGNWYHFDAAAEIHATQGSGLKYFGMSDAARSEAGSPAPYTIGSGAYAARQDTVASDVKFDSAFSNVKDFEIDVYGHFVYLSSAEAADEYQNAISTESFIPAAG